jgi:hypothetical protein
MAAPLSAHPDHYLFWWTIGTDVFKWPEAKELLSLLAAPPGAQLKPSVVLDGRGLGVI